jgi:hypothetical protein
MGTKNKLYKFSAQVGLRLYEELNERMSREEATQIRDFVASEAHQVGHIKTYRWYR